MAKASKTTAPTINIGISDKDRAAIAQGLSRLLADTYTLYLTTHNFHWNVTGPMFNTLHTMFMAQYTELWNAVDPIAERIRSLGHAAPGSYQQFAALSTLPDAPTLPPKALQKSKALLKQELRQAVHFVIDLEARAFSLALQGEEAQSRIARRLGRTTAS